MTNHRNFTYGSFALIAGFALFRMAVMGQVGLGDSESYYWAWSRHLDLSYYDHPPMVAWLIRVSTWIGGDSTFMVRLPSVILFVIMGWLFYRLSMDLFKDARIAFGSILTFNLIPMFGIGALQMVPDIPSAVCYLAFAVVANRLLNHNGPSWLWYVLGMLLGVGLLGKYFAILLLPSMMILVAMVPEYRHWYKRPEPYLMGVVALLFFSPVVIWNFIHDWPSFKFQLVNRHTGAHFTAQNFGKFIGGQLLYVTPLYLFAILWACWHGVKRALAGDKRFALLAAFSVPTLSFFYFVCVWTYEEEPHWPAFGYLTAVIMTVAFLIDKWDRRGPETLKRMSSYLFPTYLFAATGMAALVFALFYVHVFYPILPIKPKYDIVNELYGWDDVGVELTKVYGDLQKKKKPAFALARHWVMCSQMMYSTRMSVPVSCINGRMDEFDFWDDVEQLYGKTAIIVTDQRFPEKPQEMYRFDKVEKVAEIPLIRGGQEMRLFTIWVGENFMGELSQPEPERRKKRL